VHHGARARVDRLLEEGDARLAPELTAEEERRVGGRREHRPGHHLGDVVAPRELRRSHLEVHLEAGVAGLQHDVVVAQQQLVASLDVELVVAAA
jgi:hypothetical protein